jgi:E3 ubiquitin-protein ligase HOS1
MQEMGEESELAPLQKDGGLFCKSKLEGLEVCYPFENLRAAVDVLFLHGSSDLVLAKQAIVSFISLILLKYVSDNYIFSSCGT